MVTIKELSNLYMQNVYDWMIEINHETIYKHGQNLSDKL